MNPENNSSKQLPEQAGPLSVKPNLRDPQVVLSLLEADQIVAAKQRTRFGKRKLSFATRTVLWGLRVYVVAMLVIVLVSALRALHAAN